MKIILLMIIAIGIIGFESMPYSHASCATPLLGLPVLCFDSFMIDNNGVTEESIMNHIYGYIGANYDEWYVSDRDRALK